MCVFGCGGSLRELEKELATVTTKRRQVMRIQYVEQGESDFASIADFRAAHPNAGILAVDGRDCLGTCEVCDMPILVGDRHDVCDDAMLCAVCGG